jgi:uncharacterized protein (DUF1697 family)
LLRGVNVGGRNRVPMKELARIFAGIGCRDVRTYIQSGNVLFRATKSLAARVPRVVSALIREELRLEVPVLVRSGAELEAVARGNPFARRGADPASLHVAFLAYEPSGEAVAALDPDRSPPDEFVVRGREIYLRCPNGMGRSRLTAEYLDRTLGNVSTARNWNTVRKLVALAQGEVAA